MNKHKYYLILFQVNYFQVLVALQSIHATNFISGQFQILKRPNKATLIYRDAIQS